MNDAMPSNARSGSLYSLGVSCLQRGQFAEAERAFAEAARMDPHLVELHGPRGAALSHLGRHDEALSAYDRALAFNPRQAPLWNNRGNALLQLGRHTEAVGSYERALAIKPDYTDAWRHRGLALTLLGWPESALESLNKALALQPNDPGTLEDKGHLLMRLNRHADAESAYAKAIAVEPGRAGLHYNRANALSILMRYGESISECRQALAIDRNYPYARGVLIHSKLQSCDWGGLSEEKATIDAALDLGKRVISPFNYKALSDSPEDDLEGARIWIANERPANLSPLAAGARHGHSRIRLAYVSADFNLSAVATAMAGVFEQHDRNRFETFAISFGSNTPTPMRSRLRAAFDHFLDLREKTDVEIAQTMRDLEIDIAVDLMGYTGECRSWILARRPAPVQVNYLGFAGTMAADHIDYILADQTVIPEESKIHYAEKVVYLPDCYLPHDSSRAIAEQLVARASQGLPDQAFVFASFNNAYKFSRPVFDIWMRLLNAVPESVLWLPKSHAEAMTNLSREAEAHGVSARRLIFAPPIEAPEEHLARLRLADLFLDTSPYNAHSTAMDALWAGVPVLTSPGNSFQARVAASLLKACGLSDMILPFAQYEATALQLARNPNALDAIRERLAANRNTAPLFDTRHFTRGIEGAFIRMWERHERGEPPESFAVPSS